MGRAVHFALALGVALRNWLFPNDSRLGPIRGIAVFFLRAGGLFHLGIAPVAWWSDCQFEREGVRSVPVIVGKRAVVKETDGSSYYTEYYIDLEYMDEQGECHRHTRPLNQVSPHQAWERYAVGDSLAEIEYLRSRPNRFRFVTNVPWWGLLIGGSAALLVAQVVRWSARCVPASTRTASEPPS